MDESRYQCVDKDKGSYSQGHEINYEITVPDLFALQSWSFERIYMTECPYYPTIWDFKLEFLEVRQDATASMFVSFRRSDTEVIDIEAIVTIQICSGRDILVFPKQTFEKQGMLPGDELQETVEISTYPMRRGDIKNRVVVHISLMVCFCHDDTASSASMSVADADSDVNSDFNSDFNSDSD